MAPLLGSQAPGLQGGNTSFPLIGEGRRRAGGQVAGVRGPWAGLVEESRYSQGGRGETLPFCTPVTSSRAPSLSGPLPRWGPVRSPWGWGAPSGVCGGVGWTASGRAQGSGLPLELQEPWVSPLP